MALRPAINDRHITSFHEALLTQAGLESLEKVYESEWRAAAEKADDRHRPLLRPRRQRPSCCRTSEKSDELAAPHVGHGPSSHLRDTGHDTTKRPPRARAVAAAPAARHRIHCACVIPCSRAIWSA